MSSELFTAIISAPKIQAVTAVSAVAHLATCEQASVHSLQMTADCRRAHFVQPLKKSNGRQFFNFSLASFIKG